MEQSARDQLVTANSELVRKAAAQVYLRVRDHLEFAELIAIGNLGLMEAAERYDAAAGASFATFAWYRVFGAMIDAIRKASNLSRNDWQKLNALRGTQAYLEHRALQEAAARKNSKTPRTTSEALAEVKRAIAAIQTVHVLSCERDAASVGELRAEATTAADQVDTERNARRLRLALDRLSDRERALLTKHYFEDKDLKTAGEEMGHTKSWASRLHAQAVEKLRAALADALT